MKKFIIISFFSCLVCSALFAFQLDSQKELGTGEAKNQNVIVKCTTSTGKISKETCTLRRYAKCKNGKCNGWQMWKDLRNPGKSYSEWRNAATECCIAKGLR